MKHLRKSAAIALTVLSIAFFARATPGQDASPDYSIQAIRYANAEDEVAGLVMGAPKGEKINIAMVIWLIRGGGRNILFDSGYHRETFLKYFPSTDYIRPDEAVKLAGLQPDQITDIVISHAHWDHLGGIDLFPKANVWIQREEYRYYTSDAWQPGGHHGGIDPADVQQLVKLNTEGRIRLVDGDNVEIFPGIRAYTGGHHTFASQYLRVEGNPAFVLASDNCYLYRNLAEHKASATFTDDFHAANIKNQERMIQLAGGNPDRVIPGHDAAQFQKYPTTSDGRIAKIK
ncbi:MAG TPA: N-acyl homoserine lactonase family protein [Candidatus Methylomirabilis sp.]|nr:N-acyl homoserine lactonase family protein [Candidatus Methylomirabilis sp.]